VRSVADTRLALAASRPQRRHAASATCDSTVVVWNLHTRSVVQRAQALARPGLFYWAAALLVMNLLDGIFTLTAVHAGAAAEANPLMRLPLHLGAVWFIIAKTGLVSAGVLLLWRARERLLAHAGLIALTLVYAAVVAYHLSALGLWSGRLIL